MISKIIACTHTGSNPVTPTFLFFRHGCFCYVPNGTFVTTKNKDQNRGYVARVFLWLEISIWKRFIPSLTLKVNISFSRWLSKVESCQNSKGVQIRLVYLLCCYNYKSNYEYPVHYFLFLISSFNFKMSSSEDTAPMLPLSRLSRVTFWSASSLSPMTSM